MKEKYKEIYQEWLGNQKSNNLLENVFIVILKLYHNIHNKKSIEEYNLIIDFIFKEEYFLNIDEFNFLKKEQLEDFKRTFKRFYRQVNNSQINKELIKTDKDLYFAPIHILSIITSYSEDFNEISYLIKAILISYVTNNCDIKKIIENIDKVIYLDGKLDIFENVVKEVIKMNNEDINLLLTLYLLR